MKTSGPETLRVLEDDMFTADQCDACPLPGYVIVRLKGEGATLGSLDSVASARLGPMLARVARAVGEVVGAERVYCLSFGEIDPRLHFHVFPRTRALLEAYRDATGTASEAVNGPKLFEWARTVIAPGRALPLRLPDLEAVCAELRRLLSP